jgi:hypothetical protein
VDVAHLLLVPAELALLGFLGWRATRLVRAGRARAEGGDDFLGAMQSAAGEVLGAGRIAVALGYEAAVLGHAVGLAPARRAGTDDSVFTHHRDCAYGAVVAAVLLAGTVEIVAVHLLLARWSVAAAWVVSAASLYAGVWVVGDLRACGVRRTTLGGDGATFRVGLRWTVAVPYDAIERVERIGGERTADAVAKPLRLTLIGAPGVRVHLRRAVTAHGPYGLRRPAQVLEVGIDDAGTFSQRLTTRLRDGTGGVAAAGGSP